MNSCQAAVAHSSACRTSNREVVGSSPPLTNFFSRFFRFYRKWLHQSAKYYQIRARQVRISRKRHLTCLYRTILVLAAILAKTVRAVLNKTGSYWLILLIFNSKHRVPLGYIVFKFEANQSKITTVRVPHRKSAKWPPWRHQIEIFKIRKQLHWPISSRLFV